MLQDDNLSWKTFLVAINDNDMHVKKDIFPLKYFPLSYFYDTILFVQFDIYFL